MGEIGDGQEDEVTKWNIIFAEGEQSGNVARTCQLLGISRRTYYRRRRIKQQEGEEALRDRRHFKASKFDQGVREAITLAAILNPTMNCKSITTTVSAVSKRVSASTVQRILRAEGLASKEARLKKVVSIYGDRNNPLHHEVVSSVAKNKLLQELIEKRNIEINPRLRKLHKRGAEPGQFVALDVAYLGRFRNHKIYLVVMVDTYSSFAVGTLQENSSSKLALDFFKNTAIPALSKIGIVKIKEIMTDLNAKYSGMRKMLGIEHEEQQENEYEEYEPEEPVAEHERVRCNPGRHLDYIDYIKRQVRVGFLKQAQSKREELSFAELQVGFGEWLHEYNHGTNVGFPSFGRSPVAMIGEYQAAQGDKR